MPFQILLGGKLELAGIALEVVMLFLMTIQPLLVQENPGARVAFDVII